MFQSRLFRYVGRDYLMVFISANLAVVFVLIMFQMLKLSELVIGRGAGLWESVLLLSSMAVSLLPVCVPIATLVAANVVVGRMSYESELIALVAAGIPVRRVIYSLMWIALPVLVLLLISFQTIVPGANRHFGDLIANLNARSLAVVVKPGVFIDNFHGLTFYAEQLEAATETFKNVFVMDERDGRLPMVIFAKELTTDSSAKEALKFFFRDGEIHIARPDQSYQKVLYGSYQMTIPLDIQTARGDNAPLAMNFFELKHWIRETQKVADVLPVQYRRLWIEFHRRFSVPFSIPLLVIMGVLLACGHFRSMSGRPMLTSFLIALAYWVLYIFSESMARSGFWPAVVAAWFPNLVVFTACMILMRFQRKYL